MNKVEEIGKEYADLVIFTVAEIELDRIKLLNLYERHENICNSFRFVNAEKLMKAAFYNCGIDLDAVEMDDALLAMWNEALRFAKTNYLSHVR